MTHGCRVPVRCPGSPVPRPRSRPWLLRSCRRPAEASPERARPRSPRPLAGWRGPPRARSRREAGRRSCYRIRSAAAPLRASPLLAELPAPPLRRSPRSGFLGSLVPLRLGKERISGKTSDADASKEVHLRRRAPLGVRVGAGVDPFRPALHCARMFQPGLLKDKTFVITGGGSGLGAEMAKRFAELGARVALLGRRKEKLDEGVAQIERPRASASGYPCDVRDFGAVQGMASRVGQVDGLGNNAAGNLLAAAQDLSANAFNAAVG